MTSCDCVDGLECNLDYSKVGYNETYRDLNTININIQHRHSTLAFDIEHSTSAIASGGPAAEASAFRLAQVTKSQHIQIWGCQF